MMGRNTCPRFKGHIASIHTLHTQETKHIPAAMPTDHMHQLSFTKFVNINFEDAQHSKQLVSSSTCCCSFIPSASSVSQVSRRVLFNTLARWSSRARALLLASVACRSSCSRSHVGGAWWLLCCRPASDGTLLTVSLDMVLSTVELSRLTACRAAHHFMSTEHF